jgi:tetratricopeptide (TPR) repeat protein
VLPTVLLACAACGPGGPADEQLEHVEALMQRDVYEEALPLLEPLVKDELAKVMERAEFLVLEQRFSEAIPLLRGVLRWRPHDAAAHYYLGRAYYNAPDNFWFGIAKGEIKTALALFLKDGRESPIERFSDEYFELNCHLDIARIHSLQAVAILQAGAPAALALQYLDQAEDALEAAEEVVPGAQEIQHIQQGIDDVRAGVRQGPRPQQPSPDQRPSRQTPRRGGQFI